MKFGPTDISVKAGGAVCRGLNLLSWIENLLITAALAALLILPLAEILLRSFFRSGISGSSSLVQHFTLLVGMLGGVIAAREGRLLSLSAMVNFLKGRSKTAALIFSNAFAAAISIFLCVASARFLLAERAGGKILAYGIPVWVVQLALPLGFGLIALRLLWQASENWKQSLIGVLVCGAFLWAGFHSLFASEGMLLPGLLLVLVATIVGTPIFGTIGGVTLILLWAEQLPVESIPLKHYSLVTNPTLPTIPLFTLAGYFLAEGGASKRLIRVFQALFGQFLAGPALATVLVCTFFTSFTGASGVTILALGGLLMPVLLAARYSERKALGLLTAAGSLGVLFPPCLPLILYAIIASTVTANLGAGNPEARYISMEEMFLGGLGPGLLLVALTVWLAIRQSVKGPVSAVTVSWQERWQSVWEAKWELLLPVVALVALFGGWATPVEAAAATAFYAFVVETFVYRDLSLTRQVPRVMTECGLLVGGVLLILGVAMGFTHYLILQEVPARLVEWVTGAIHSRWLFLLALNFFLLIVGCLMDIFSATVVVVPLIVPIGIAFGVDPIHLGIIFLANLQLGYLTPPVGMNLFLSSYRFGKPLGEVIRSVIPALLVLMVGVLLITYLPALSTFLPGLLRK